MGNTQNVNILGNGSASFGQASNSTNNNGILLGADVGQLNLYTTRYSTDAFQILNTSGSGTNVAVRFDGDGSATFAGSVSATVGSFSGNVTSARTSSSHTCFNGTLNGTTTSNILADGSATFEGAVAVNNLLYARQDTGSSDAFSVYSGGLAGSNKTANISGNGSATFGVIFYQQKVQEQLKQNRLHIVNLQLCMLAMDQMILLYFGQAAHFAFTILLSGCVSIVQGT